MAVSLGFLAIDTPGKYGFLLLKFRVPLGYYEVNVNSGWGVDNIFVKQAFDIVAFVV